MEKRVTSRSDDQWAGTSTSSTQLTTTGRPRPHHARAAKPSDTPAGGLRFLLSHPHSASPLQQLLFIAGLFSERRCSPGGGKDKRGACAIPRLGLTCARGCAGYPLSLICQSYASQVTPPSIPSFFQSSSRTSHQLSSTFTTSFHHLASLSPFHQPPTPTLI
ncbi:hypothetical protein E2C01_051873 [Portunus trituberculatus]|uniref:Uncharacterized protein n=1 Tax=Portunus trituberculatus TaxID=210409 RepID=A0A5B7GMW2_PORTR|nr:hypothetical protein [Portunus trituberculatus]